MITLKTIHVLIKLSSAPTCICWHHSSVPLDNNLFSLHFIALVLIALCPRKLLRTLYIGKDAGHGLALEGSDVLHEQREWFEALFHLPSGPWVAFGSEPTWISKPQGLWIPTELTTRTLISLWRKPASVWKDLVSGLCSPEGVLGRTSCHSWPSRRPGQLARFPSCRAHCRLFICCVTQPRCSDISEWASCSPWRHRAGGHLPVGHGEAFNLC